MYGGNGKRGEAAAFEGAIWGFESLLPSQGIYSFLLLCYNISMNTNIPGQELPSEAIEQLRTLEARVREMHPEACGHVHEQRIVDQRKNGVKFTEQNVPFCPEDYRMNNPACAHCFRNSGRQQMETLLPFLAPHIEKYVSKTGSTGNGPPILANPFALELAHAHTLGAFFSQEEMKEILDEAGRILNNSDIWPLQDMRYMQLQNDALSDLRRISENQFFQTMSSDYVLLLRKIIHRIDTIAQQDANEGHDLNAISSMQKMLVKLLEDFKEHLLAAIHRRITEL